MMSMLAEQTDVLTLRSGKEIDMRWNRTVDYHGSRSYELDEAIVGLSGMKWLMNGLRRMFRAPPRRPSSRVLLHDGERHFSLLGTPSLGKPSRRVADCPFPTNTPTSNLSSYLRHED
jgi:hypothetical protein